jgi:hypothetical protein
MNIQELENAILIIKWIYPIISFCFLAIVSLLIYIWKTNTARTDKILEKTNETLACVVTIQAVHESRIKGLEIAQ